MTEESTQNNTEKKSDTEQKKIRHEVGENEAPEPGTASSELHDTPIPSPENDDPSTDRLTGKQVKFKLLKAEAFRTDKHPPNNDPPHKKDDPPPPPDPPKSSS